MKHDDVIVIGAGLGGLTAASYLAKEGYKVKVFERLNQPGGCVNTFKIKDYFFEGSTHQICGFSHPKYLKNAFLRLGLSPEILIELDNSFQLCMYDNRIIKDFKIKSGFKNALESFLFYFPNFKKEILYTLNKSKKVSYDLFRLLRLLRENSFFHLYDAITALFMLNAKEGSILKFVGDFSYKNFKSVENKTLEEFFSFINNEDLKRIFSLYSFYQGYPPEKIPATLVTAMIYLFIWEKPLFIKGGTKTIIDKLIENIKKNNGEIIFNSKVTSIITENSVAKGVILEDGSSYRAKYIISNANAYSTYNELIKEKNLLSKQTKEKILNYRSSVSGFQIFIGLPFDIRDYGFNCSTTFFVPTRKDINSLFTDFKISQENDFYFLMTNYTLMDKNFSPRGKSSIVIFAYDDFSQWPERGSIEYSLKKKETEKILLEKISKITEVPFEKAEVIVSATPQTIKYYMGNINGGFIGAELNFNQAGLKRFSQKTEIKNLFLVGADTVPSGGFSTSFDSGMIAGRFILNS